MKITQIVGNLKPNSLRRLDRQSFQKTNEFYLLENYVFKLEIFCQFRSLLILVILLFTLVAGRRLDGVRGMEYRGWEDRGHVERKYTFQVTHRLEYKWLG